MKQPGLVMRRLAMIGSGLLCIAGVPRGATGACGTRTQAQLAAALNGFGFAILPSYLAEQHADSSCVLPTKDVVTRALWLVRHRDLENTARVRVLVDFLARDERRSSAARRAGPGRVSAASHRELTDPNSARGWYGRSMRLFLATGLVAFAISTLPYAASARPAPPPPTCGNNIVDPGEGCDDGNVVSGDGCSAVCVKEDEDAGSQDSAVPLSDAGDDDAAEGDSAIVPLDAGNDAGPGPGDAAALDRGVVIDSGADSGHSGHDGASGDSDASSLADAGNALNDGAATDGDQRTNPDLVEADDSCTCVAAREDFGAAAALLPLALVGLIARRRRR